ncbi:MAG: hypothetical protein WCR55_11275 [Lentisphaerota bacterium]
MITFLSSTKAFIGQTAVQQMTAIRSWQALHPDIEIILYGNSPGTDTACQELRIRHVPNIESTEQGIPYFGAIANHADKHARYDVQVYLNCDILLTPHILKAVEGITFSHFLMIGQRIDLSEGVDVDVSNPDIITELDELEKAGRITLHPPAGSDYFVFRRGMWSSLPLIVIGRGGYDNALIAYCLQRRIPIIDATLSVLALHQFHDYAHAAGGVKEVFEGGDSMQNLSFVPMNAIPVLEDANYLLLNNNLSPNKCRKDLLRFNFIKYRYNNVLLIPDVFRILWLIQIKLGLRHQWEPTLEEVISAYQKKQ